MAWCVAIEPWVHHSLTTINLGKLGFWSHVLLYAENVFKSNFKES